MLQLFVIIITRNKSKIEETKQETKILRSALHKDPKEKKKIIYNNNNLYGEVFFKDPPFRILREIIGRNEVYIQLY